MNNGRILNNHPVSTSFSQTQVPERLERALNSWVAEVNNLGEKDNRNKAKGRILEFVATSITRTQGGTLDLTNLGLTSLPDLSGFSLDIVTLVLKGNNLTQADLSRLPYMQFLREFDITNNQGFQQHSSLRLPVQTAGIEPPQTSFLFLCVDEIYRALPSVPLDSPIIVAIENDAPDIISNDSDNDSYSSPIHHLLHLQRRHSAGDVVNFDDLIGEDASPRSLNQQIIHETEDGIGQLNAAVTYLDLEDELHDIDMTLEQKIAIPLVDKLRRIFEVADESFELTNECWNNNSLGDGFNFFISRIDEIADIHDTRDPEIRKNACKQLALIIKKMDEDSNLRDLCVVEAVESTDSCQDAIHFGFLRMQIIVLPPVGSDTSSLKNIYIQYKRIYALNYITTVLVADKVKNLQMSSNSVMPINEDVEIGLAYLIASQDILGIRVGDMSYREYVTTALNITDEEIRNIRKLTEEYIENSDNIYTKLIEEDKIRSLFSVEFEKIESEHDIEAEGLSPVEKEKRITAIKLQKINVVREKHLSEK